MPDFIRPDWPAPVAIRAFTTTRRLPGHSQPPFDTFNLGARCGDDPHAVAANRATLQSLAKLPASPHWLAQVHGTAVHAVTQQNPPAEEPVADAAITSLPDTVLAILTADCLPVLFCSQDGRHIAAAHAGWRGLAAGVLEATVARFPVPSESLLAWLGPVAGAQHYEIGDEVREAFLQNDPTAHNTFVPTRPGHWLIDLPALARRRLAAVGVTQVYGGNWCTLSDTERFYSYRREGQTGRLASLIWIERGAD